MDELVLSSKKLAAPPAAQKTDCKNTNARRLGRALICFYFVDSRTSGGAARSNAKNS